MSFIVAIDGPAGSGKGTIAKIVAKDLGFLTMDTGAMYRCVTVYFIDNEIDLENEEDIKYALTKINIDMKEIEGVQNFFLNGENVSSRIRTKEVDALVSQVSHVLPVRLAMVELQRKLADGKNIVMEGRDIGTNVFPGAQVKIYLDATPEERARRRLEQNKAKGIDNVSYEEILENVKFRDHNDLTSPVAPLKKAEDAVVVDSSNLSIPEVVKKVEMLIKERMNGDGKSIKCMESN
ncbi:MAG: (d)CMP kinase [Clostridia bacterium]|nr:(d)CMP kinase [Clostridia bacterium]